MKVVCMECGRYHFKEPMDNTAESHTLCARCAFAIDKYRVYTLDKILNDPDELNWFLKTIERDLEYNWQGEEKKNLNFNPEALKKYNEFHEKAEREKEREARGPEININRG